MPAVSVSTCTDPRKYYYTRSSVLEDFDVEGSNDMEAKWDRMRARVHVSLIGS